MSARILKITVAILRGSVAILILWFAGRHFLAWMDYSLISKAPSPNGELTIHEFESNQDGFGHAPYGVILAISQRKKLISPDDGYVFFAGYCRPPLAYEWHGNENISVRCIDGNSGEGPRTLTSVAYGVKVSYSWQ